MSFVYDDAQIFIGFLIDLGATNLPVSHWVTPEIISVLSANRKRGGKTNLDDLLLCVSLGSD